MFTFKIIVIISQFFFKLKFILLILLKMFFLPFFFFIFSLFFLLLHFLILFVFFLVFFFFIIFFIFICLSNNGINIGFFVLLKINFKIIRVNNIARNRNLWRETWWLYCHDCWVKHLIWKIIMTLYNDTPAFSQLRKNRAPLCTNC